MERTYSKEYDFDASGQLYEIVLENRSLEP